MRHIFKAFSISLRISTFIFAFMLILGSFAVFIGSFLSDDISLSLTSFRKIVFLDFVMTTIVFFIWFVFTYVGFRSYD